MSKIRNLFLTLLHVALLTVHSANSWSAEFLTQTQALRCKPSDKQEDHTFVHGREAGNFTTLGQVADMDVCVLLCCELDTCQAAYLEDRNCFSVRCLSGDHCAIAPSKGHSVAFVSRLAEDQHLNDAKPIKTSVHANVETNPLPEKPAPPPQVVDSKPVEAPSPVNPHKNETLPQLQAVQADKQTKVDKQKEVKKIQYSLISAAVATCLVAFILTGIALIAVKIRRQRDEQENGEEKVKLAEEGND